MSKTLQQITFDFSSDEEKEVRITGHVTEQTPEEELVDPRLEESSEPDEQPAN
jgi:hypothetical protein